MGILSNKTNVCDNQKFPVLYTNEDCLTNKIDELRLLLSTLDYKPTAIVVTEVNAKVSACPMQEFEFNIDGYTLHCLNVGRKSFRCICIYVDRNISSSIIEINCDFTEFLCVSIRDSYSILFTLCAVYRSPSSNTLNDSKLFQLLSMLKSVAVGKCLLIGDFNFCNIDWNTCTIAGTILGNTPPHKFLSSMNKKFLTQHTAHSISYKS